MESTYTKCAAPPSTSRNTGIDLLRIVAACYMIVLHILGPGGLLWATTRYSTQFFICKAFLIFTYCAVNIFGIISGYVGYTEEERPLKFKSYLNLWLEVVFYNILLTLLTIWLRPELAEPSSLIPVLCPVINNKHWYFTAYTGLFLFIPILNTAVRHSSRNTLLLLLGCIVFVLAPLETLFDVFEYEMGYSPIWLIILYLIGAILKKTQFGANIHPLFLLSGIFGISFFTFYITRHYVETFAFNHRFYSEMVENYVYPGNLINGILYVLLFAKLRLGKLPQKLIALAAPGAFAVYIINTQQFVWHGYMKNHFRSWANVSPAGIVVRIVVTTFVFVTVSLIVDYFRRLLFRLFQKRRA